MVGFCKIKTRKMGVDYYNCDVCQDIFSDCSGYGYCDGCYKRWCQSCYVAKFIFDGRERCDLCWNDACIPVKSKQLLEFCCKKYKTTPSEIEEEFRQEAGPAYQQPEDSYYCTSCIEGECASSKCVRIDDYCDVEDDDGDVRHVGYCCRAQIKYCGADEDDICDECRKWERRRSAYTLLALRCFRPKTPFAKLPKDVLIYLIKQGSV